MNSRAFLPKLLRTILLSTAVLSAAADVRAGVSGSVYGPDGAPVAGARVALLATETSEARLERLRSASPARMPLVFDGKAAVALTDAAGAFRIAAKPAPGWELEIDAEGFAPALIRPASPSGILVPLRSAPTTTGRVSASGKPVAGATVVYRDGDRDYIARSDDAGRFHVPDPRKWAYRATVFHSGFAPHTAHSYARFTQTAFELEPGIEVRGRVTGTAAGAAIMYVDDVPAGRTAEDGSFVLQHVSKNWRRIEARTASAIARVETRAGELTLALRPSAVVRGVVRDERSRAAIAGVRVLLRQMDAQEPLVAITDPRGAYRFDRVYPDRYGIEADAPGYAPTGEGTPEESPMVDARVERTATRDLTLRPAQTITGRVVDEAGDPVAAALVGIGGAGSHPAHSFAHGAELQTRSLPDGHFTIRAPWLNAAAPLRVWASKNGYALSRSPRVEPRADRTLTANVTLLRGVRVAGRVTDADGAPLPAAAVAWSRRGENAGYHVRPQQLLGGEMTAWWPRTNAAGEFEFQAEPGEYDLAAYTPGYQVAGLDGVRVASDMSPVAFRLERAASIRGRVVRPGSVGVPGVSVAVFDSRPGVSEPAVTDADGAFVVADLPPGSWRLGFFKAEELINENRSVTAPAENVLIELPAAGTLRGRVVDAAGGTPVGRFQIHLNAASGRDAREQRSTMREFNDAGGTFAFENIPTGAYELRAGAPEYVSAEPVEVTVTAETGDEVRIALARGVTVTGRVTDDSGRAVAGVNIGIQHDGTEERRRIMQPPTSVTDDNGEFELIGLAPSKMIISAHKQGWVPARREIDAALTNRSDLTLSRGVTLSGVVLSGGRPVAGAEVNAHTMVVNGESQSATSGTSGEFTITGLLPYHYTIYAMKDGVGRAELKDVDVRSAGRMTIELQTPRTSIIHGRVSGLAAPGEGRMLVRMVNAYSESGGGQAEIDAAGNYRIEDAPTGEVRVTAHVQTDSLSRSSMMRVVEIAPGAEVQVDLDFPTALVVRGQVTREGVPFPGAYVSFTQDGIAGGGGSAVSRDDGRYEVTLDRGGAWRIMVHAPNLRVPWRALRQIDGSQTIDVEIREISVEGRVLDASTGSPLRDASILIIDASGDAVPLAQVQSGSQGDFSMALGVAGTYTLLVEKRGYGQVTRELALDRSMTGMMIELSPGEGASIRLIDARNGAPLSGVLLVRDGNGGVAANRYQTPRSDGSIPLSLAPGEYEITTLVYGFASRRIRITAPSGTRDVALTPGGSLRIEAQRELRTLARLVDDAGRPYVACCEGTPVFALDGRVTRLPNVLPGQWRLQLLADDGSVTATYRTAVAEGAETRIGIE